MSVTFFVESPASDVYVAECDLMGELARGAINDVEGAIDAHPWETCDGCIGYRPYAEMVTDLPANAEVNLANSNAVRMLRILGLANGHQDFTLALALSLTGLNQTLPQDDADFDDLAGELPADQFLGRVVLALAGDLDDAGTSAVQVGNLIIGGQAEGYVFNTLTRLHEVGLIAHRLGRRVLWA